MLMVHNATHQPALALAVLLGSAVTGLSPFFYIGALAWLGHIVVGWGTGDRIRSTEAPVPRNREPYSPAPWCSRPNRQGSSAR